MPSHKRNFFVLSLIIILVVGGFLIWYILRESAKFGFDDVGVIRSGRATNMMTPEEQMRKVLTESRSFAGTIEQVTTPKDSGVKFLQIRTSVVDESQLSDADFSSGSRELPLQEELVDVTITNETKFSSDVNLDTVHSGMMVAVRTNESLSSGKQLVAESLDVLGTSAPASGPSPRAQK